MDRRQKLHLVLVGVIFFAIGFALMYGAKLVFGFGL